MVQSPVLRQARRRPPIPPVSGGRRASSGPAKSGGAPDEIQDLLGAMTDRPDLERLFEKRVALPDILRLMGRYISREQIHDLLASPHVERDIKKLLG